MRKKIISFLFIGAMVISMVGCHKETFISDNTADVITTTPEAPDCTVSPEAEVETIVPTPGITTETTDDEPNKPNQFSFGDLEDIQFSFSSGAGAWSTDLLIDSDGSFAGAYHDSDMGDVHEDYPSGTMYYCTFTGQFNDLVKVSKYCYKTSIASIELNNEVGTEKVTDGIRFVYSYPYGLEDAQDIFIYLPGMSTSDLPEGYLSWVRTSLYKDYDSMELVDVLPFYGLYNAEMEEGFLSYDLSEIE